MDYHYNCYVNCYLSEMLYLLLSNIKNLFNVICYFLLFCDVVNNILPLNRRVHINGQGLSPLS